jgi:hypothetical protein
MCPSSSQIQTSDAPASKYRAVFSWISCAVLDGERTSTQISGACVRHIKERTSWRRSGTTHATSGAFTPSEVEAGQSVQPLSFGRQHIALQENSSHNALWLNSNKGTKSDMGVCPKHSALESYTYVEPPITGPNQAANFGSLIPTESRRFVAGDMLPRLSDGLARCSSFTRKTEPLPIALPDRVNVIGRDLWRASPAHYLTT